MISEDAVATATPTKVEDNVTLSNFFDDIVMPKDFCRKDKQECDSCSG